MHYAEKWKRVRGNLMMVLHGVQQDMGYVPREVAMGLSKALQIPLARFYEVLTFYHYFKLAPQGKYSISVCLGTACYLKGSANLQKAIEQKLKISAGQTTEDGLFHLDVARCVGACGLAPVVTINGYVFGKATEETIFAALRERAEAEGVNLDEAYGKSAKA
jgi:NADH-quinone oxidoreductase subunit E